MTETMNPEFGKHEFKRNRELNEATILDLIEDLFNNPDLAQAKFDLLTPEQQKQFLDYLRKTMAVSETMAANGNVDPKDAQHAIEVKRAFIARNGGKL